MRPTWEFTPPPEPSRYAGDPVGDRFFRGLMPETGFGLVLWSVGGYHGHCVFVQGHPNHPECGPGEQHVHERRRDEETQDQAD